MKFRLLILSALLSAAIGIIAKSTLILHIGTGFAAVAVLDTIIDYFKEAKDEA